MPNYWLVCCPPAWLQVAHLPRLASLSLDGCGYSAANLNVLSRLSGSLTHLDIKSGWIPGSLSALTQLRDLRLWDSDTREDDAALSSVLPCFSQLTCLVSVLWDAACAYWADSCPRVSSRFTLT